ncbi:MAG: hypothetical protein V4694_02755 [Pseudomonadota bacterium]
MTKMTIEIPDEEYKKLESIAVNLGVSIKDYILEAVRVRQKILMRDDGTVRVLKEKTIAALEESRKKKNKLMTFKSSKEAFMFLDKTTTYKNLKELKNAYKILV